ncbi:sulfatase-like hydrolase/transferase [Clostridium sp. MCC353]|uniref:sulfatase-like hydrolase/transferase n=1 Tax=Clostridium sp. MCC353 TaxID=2592646 RepID=UPI00207AEE03|nr:sulfatase-like hydrolase/transferase [Clostridium sp. MCC353]
MEKTNVLMICTDHWASSFMGCAGHKVLMTPTLDYLAENGLRFTNYYSECPVCIPARRTMMTGLCPKSHGDRVYSDHMEMPDCTTLAQAFRNAGYQAYGVGKLHVYPQRNRIGFDDVILQEEGRYEIGAVDDYQIWLGENGFAGQEFLHGMGNNNYYTRPWHLTEEAHPTNWATKEMMKLIKRKDPTRPAFFYLSYQFPHPPLVPLQVYLDMYDENEIDEPCYGNWEEKEEICKILSEPEQAYSRKEMIRARRAFYAQCTHIDFQIRLLIGTLRECGLLENTIIVFTSDHGDMLFDHHLVAKRCMYENSSCVPLVISGRPVQDRYKDVGRVITKLGGQADLMPTLLDICRIPEPKGMDGRSLMSGIEREYLYGEVSEGVKATRMIVDGQYKLIYYSYGNVTQLFDLKNDRKEQCDLSENPEYREVLDKLKSILIKELYGEDLNWIKDGQLVGMEIREERKRPDYGLYNQRGYHWPPPVG